MTELTDVVQRLRRKEGIRSIQRNTGIHRTVIRELADEAQRQGWLDTDRPPPDGPTIDAVWRSTEDPPKEHSLEAYATEIAGYLKSGLSMQSIHVRIRGRHACDESTVRRFIHRRFPDATPIRPSMLRPREPGILEVDFAQLPAVLDDAGVKHKSWVFSGRLRFSRWAYREVVLDQRTGTFLRCVENALVALGGVPEQVVPDNLKAAVVRASFEDPILNRSFQDLARHYGFRVAPCDPGAPRQKAGVENDMRFIQGNFLPGFLHDQRQLGRETPWQTDLVRGLVAWSAEQELRTIAGVGRTVIDLLAEERSHLHPLPHSRWTPIDWEEQTVRRDWHVTIRRAQYSVPHRLIGQKVQVAVSPHQTRIFHQQQEVANHPIVAPGQSHTDPSHAPPGQADILTATKPGLIAQATAIGPSTQTVIQGILNDPVYDGLRPARRLLRMANSYGPQRLESACTRALRYDAASYGSVREILIKGLDRATDDPLQTETNHDAQPPHGSTTKPADPPSSREPAFFTFARSPLDYITITICITLIPGAITWTTALP